MHGHDGADATPRSVLMLAFWVGSLAFTHFAIPTNVNVSHDQIHHVCDQISYSALEATLLNFFIFIYKEINGAIILKKKQ